MTISKERENQRKILNHISKCGNSSSYMVLGLLVLEGRIVRYGLSSNIPYSPEGARADDLCLDRMNSQAFLIPFPCI